MFYEIKVEGYIRIQPEKFKEEVNKALLDRLNEQFEGYISKELGFIISILKIDEIGDGVIIPGDGAAYYKTTFTVLTYKPELQEVILGKISDITDFGAFLDIGTIDGMVHVSQTMDDYVTFSKSNVLTGKESKKVLKINDKCRARIIAISFKDPSNPKIGLTMRQASMGNLKWIEEELKKKNKKKK